MRLLAWSPGRLILAAGLLAAAVLCAGPLFNPDLGWHLAAAKHMVAARAVPRQDFLSWTKTGTPWVDFEWGAQLVFYALNRFGGLTALWLFKSIFFFGITLIFVALLRLWALPAAWIGFGAPILMVALYPACDARPEQFTLLFFMAEFYLLERRRLGHSIAEDRAMLAAHVLLYAVWANLHAGFVIALGLCAAYGIAEWVRPPQNPRGASPLSWAAAGALGTLINPYGPGLYAVFWDHWRHFSVNHRLINEWGEPSLGNEYEEGYWFVVVFSLSGLIWAVAQGVELPPEHVVAIVVFGVFASRSYRTTVFAALLILPLGLKAWRELRSPAWWRPAMPWVLAAGVAVGGWRTARVLRADGVLRRTTRLDFARPDGAARFLIKEKAALSGLRLYNPYTWGGYIDLNLYPDYRVFMDGRYLFADILPQVADAAENPDHWRRLMEEQNIELALLNNYGHVIRMRDLTFWRAFETYAMPRSDWALIYWDSQAMIMVRRSKVPADWLKTREYRLLRPHDLRHLGLQVLSGWVSIEDVSAEIRRYQREIGDPKQSLILWAWLAEFKKGLAKSGG